MSASVGELAITAVFLVAFALGVRSTVRLYRRWRVTRSTWVLGFFAVSLALTLLAGWVGFLSLRRLLGFEPLTWSVPVSYVLAIIAAVIPSWLETLVSGIESGRRAR